MCGVWVVPIVGGISPVKQERMLKKLPEVAAFGVMHHNCSCNCSVLMHTKLQSHVMQYLLRQLLAPCISHFHSR